MPAEAFPVHPGEITFLRPGRPPEVVRANSVPDEIAFVYRLDEHGRRIGREPVVKVAAELVDEHGRVVVGGPSVARGAIVLYGSDDRALKSITRRETPRRA